MGRQCVVFFLGLVFLRIPKRCALLAPALRSSEHCLADVLAYGHDFRRFGRLILGRLLRGGPRVAESDRGKHARCRLVRGAGVPFDCASLDYAPFGSAQGWRDRQGRRSGAQIVQGK
jgi:hypothetical protein